MHDQSDDCPGKKELKSTKRELFMNHMRSIQVHFHNVNCQKPPPLCFQMVSLGFGLATNYLFLVSRPGQT